MDQSNKKSPESTASEPSEEKKQSIIVFADLVAYRAACLASALAAGLAFTAATGFKGFL